MNNTGKVATGFSISLDGLVEHLKVAPISLEGPRVSIGKGVTHLTYHIKKER